MLPNKNQKKKNLKIQIFSKLEITYHLENAHTNNG